MADTLKAAIFDMDGLLLDTERPAVNAWAQATAEMGLSLPEAVVIGTIGRDWEATKRIILETLGDGAPYDALIERVQAIYHRFLTDGVVPVKPGAVEILRMMRDIGLTAGLATSTVRKSMEWKMRSAGLLYYFSASACGDEVSQSKPQPDIYLLAAKCIGVEPEYCVALEDSPAGIMAAKAAGMTTVMVPDLVQPDEEILKVTDYVVKDLYEAGKLLLKLLDVHSC
jgi:HAD superfamily hydrolase (TIGR01509 family)